jgi:hypothetical protein
MKSNINNKKTLIKDFVLKRAKPFAVFILFIFSISIYAESSVKKDNVQNHLEVNIEDHQDVNNSSNNSSLSNDDQGVIYVYGGAAIYDSLKAQHYKIVRIEKKSQTVAKEKKLLAKKDYSKKNIAKKVRYFVKYFYKDLNNDCKTISSGDKDLVFCSTNRAQNFSKNIECYNLQIIRKEEFVTQQDYNYINPFIKNNQFLGKYSVRPPTLSI